MAAREGATAPGAGTNQVQRWRYGDVGDSNFVVHASAVPLLVGLLAGLVAFVALCLFLRWRCNRYTHDPEAAAEAASSSLAAPASVPGLDADAIRALPVTLYRPPGSTPSPHQDGKGEDQAAVLCSICISALVAGEKVKELPPCGHCFHPDCVDAWLRSHPSCPMCRCLLLAATKPDVNGDDAAV